MNKQIGITLEQIKQSHMEQTGGDASTTKEVEDPSVYEVTKLRNAVVVDYHPLGSKKTITLRVGDRLSEEDASSIAECDRFDVTVTK